MATSMTRARRWHCAFRLILTTACGFALWAYFAAPSRAAGPIASDPIAAHIAAGEFAPALKLAQQLADRDERDAWLARIAQAQYSVGARKASLSTASAMSDDRARSTALKQLAPPRGALGGAQADFDSLIELITST